MFHKFSISVIITAFAYSVFATSQDYEMSQHTLSELRALLDAPDSHIREKAATYIGLCYQNPNAIVVNGNQFRSASPPELPVPGSLIEKLDQMVIGDENMKVRVSALAALYEMKFWTNTSPLIVQFLKDTNSCIKLRAADVLIQIGTEYHEEHSGEVIPTLTSIIETESDTEQLWQAAYYLGQLGEKAKSAIPALEHLRQNRSKKVRHYAKEAVSKIRDASQKRRG